MLTLYRSPSAANRRLSRLRSQIIVLNFKRQSAASSPTGLSLICAQDLRLCCRQGSIREWAVHCSRKSASHSTHGKLLMSPLLICTCPVVEVSR